MTSYEKFCGNKLSRRTTFKRFHGNKKGENLNLWEETYVFIVLRLRWDTWPVLKSPKKSFKKLVFLYSLLLEFLIFWNFTNATIIWYYTYKSVFFQNFAGRNFRGWRLKTTKVSSFKVASLTFIFGYYEDFVMDFSPSLFLDV